MEPTPFHGNIGFNAQHSPIGAFFSFTCGHFGTRGGFGLQIGKPGNQDLFIGVKDGDRFSDEPLMCLPFFEGASSMQGAAQAFLVEQGAVPKPTGKPGVLPIAREAMHRHYRWATDAWHAHDFEFAIYTPFGPIPDPDKEPAGEALLPAVVAELVVHNRGAKTKTACFAIGFQDPGLRLLDEGIGAGRIGFALHDRMGVLAELEGGAPSPPAFPFMRWAPHEGLRDANPVHLLGTCAGIGFEIPPGQSRSLRIALGVYLGGVVTTRLEGRYLYTRSYAGLTDVLRAALDRFPELEDRAANLDLEMMQSGLSADQQFLIAHATRSYYGSTQMLEVGGRPFWIVNEGEYCMMNTLDLAVDQVFWELKQNPWVVRNLLDNFVRFYSYHDQCGISFCHDMGVHNNFSPLGHSSYELPNLKGCFSYMTQEQVCNWILIAASYVAKTGDFEWAKQRRPIVNACLGSLTNRGFDAMETRDSSRCGTGQEITTYDSLDASLGQARNNLYMLMKGWAALLGFGVLSDALGEDHDATRDDAYFAGANILMHQKSDGTFPAVFEKDSEGYAARILPMTEGLVYPHFWSFCGERYAWWKTFLEGERAGALMAGLRRHVLALLTDPEHRNLFPDGGLKLSSTSNNSWISKIAIFQHVAREVFHLDDDPAIAELFAKADAAHVRWETEGKSAYWAMSDQMLSGEALGSKYYPRCITTALWLDGRRARQAATRRPQA